MKTKNCKVVPNQDTSLHVAILCKAPHSAGGDFISFTPIVAWAVTVDEENPEQSWAAPVTVDHLAGERNIVVNRVTLEWWDFGMASGQGTDSLLSELTCK